MSDHDVRQGLLASLADAPLAEGAPEWAQTAAAEAGLVAPNVCLLTPEAVAGPGSVDPRLVRDDIRDGRPGVPLELVLQVVDENCRPVVGARVDAWHCDAEGNYSGFAETYLRGIQATGAEGVAAFTTIWPGWYSGRTPHVHYRVTLADGRQLSSQMFFPDGTSEAIYRDVAPYAERAAAQDTDNTSDRLARDAGVRAVAQISRNNGRFRAALVVAVCD